MDQAQWDNRLRGIRQLLSHLQNEVLTLEQNYAHVFQTLHQLEGKAKYDDLSGLLRRSAFFEKWFQLLSTNKNKQNNCGLLMVDIDHFKALNDTHGHPTGDEVIKRVADLLKKFESPNCFAGRYGGEEFIVAVKGTDAEMIGLGEMIRRGIERLHGEVLGSSGKTYWKCTASVGLATATRYQYDTKLILKAADEALYCAKQKGRNQVITAA